MKLAVWPATFVLGYTLASQDQFKKFDFDDSWFSKSADEIECGYHCGDASSHFEKFDGEWCQVKKIRELLNEAGDRVVNGENAQPDEIPWQVSIRKFNFMKAGTHFCGGSILNRNWILTATHCLQDQFGTPTAKVANTGVVVGSTKRTVAMMSRITHPSNQWNYYFGNDIHMAKRFVVHPEYENKWNVGVYNDIALIELKTPIRYPEEKTEVVNGNTKVNVHKYTTLVRPVCLPHPNYEQKVLNHGLASDNEDLNCQISGFGQETLKTSSDIISIDRDYQYDHLNKASMSINQSPATCLAALQNVRPSQELTDSNICVLGELKQALNGQWARVDTCTGDSGGPLTCLDKEVIDNKPHKEWRRAQFAIVSYGFQCGLDYPGVYERVTPHYDWIRKYTTDIQIIGGGFSGKTGEIVKIEEAPKEDCHDWESDSMGLEYQGTQASGIGRYGVEFECANWSEKGSNLYPPYKENHNYCRNPDNDPHGLWCYKKDHQEGEGRNYVYCKKSIPQCVPKCNKPTHSYKFFAQTIKEGYGQGAPSTCSPEFTIYLSDGSKYTWESQKCPGGDCDYSKHLTMGTASKWKHSNDVFEACDDEVDRVEVKAGCNDNWHGRMMLKRQDLSDKGKKKFWRLKFNGRERYEVSLRNDVMQMELEDIR